MVDRRAEAIWVGLITAALGWDVYLIRGGYRPLTAAARRPAGWVFTVIVIAHFGELLGRYDPFSLACRHLTPKGDDL